MSSSRPHPVWPAAAALAGGILLGVGAWYLHHDTRGTASTKPPGEAPPGMVWIPGGQFQMGSYDRLARPAEQPVHEAYVDGFWMDATEVTNAQFAAFVDATGYVTMAEQAPNLDDILGQRSPGSPPPPADSLVPGSLVFTPTDGPVPLDRYDLWWTWTPGANWRHPEGPGSTIAGREEHPVVHVAYDDAVAYATWAGKRLPTEAEWEFAARGGLDGKPYVWGDKPFSPEHPQANIWEGQFPYRNTRDDGFERTAPVASFAPNGFGLFDMSGNVWEWCSDWFRPDAYALSAGAGPVRNPTGPAQCYVPNDPLAVQRVIRGGSFLCNDSYCSAYRPSARQGGTVDTGLSHLGFRCVMTPAMQAAAKSREVPNAQ